MAKQSSAGIWKWVVIGLAALILTCGVAGYRLWTTGAQLWNDVKTHPPYMRVEAKVVDGRLELHLTYDPAAVGVRTLAVVDETDNFFWRIDGGGLGKVPVIVYGQVPVEPGVRWIQQIPTDGPPPALPRGKPVKVVLEWQYSGGQWVGTQRSETVINLPD
jgi:hypothetical protein